MVAGFNDQLKNGASLAARCIKSATAAAATAAVVTTMTAKTGGRPSHPAPAGNTEAPGRKRRGNRGVDVHRFRQRYVALEVMYIGWNYHGFTAQFTTAKPRCGAEGGQIRTQILRDEQHPTVEGAIFRALRRTRLVDEEDSLHGIKYSRCGRTDKGVSALGQVIALKLRSRQLLPTVDVLRGSGAAASTQNCGEGAAPTPDAQGGPDAHRESPPPAPPADISPSEEIDYVRTLNTHLPSEIRILGWCDVPDNFDARFSCSWRQYKYLFTFDNRGLREPAVDIDAMQTAAKMLEGEHDFRNFCKADVENVQTFERRILSSDIRRESDAMYSLNIRGSAFLYNQVRCVMAILMMIGKREETPEIVKTLLDVEKTPRKPQYTIADPDQLILHSVGYNTFEMRWNRPQQSNLSTIALLIEAQRSVSLRNALLATCSETVLLQERSRNIGQTSDVVMRAETTEVGSDCEGFTGQEPDVNMPSTRIAATVTAASLGKNGLKHVPLMKRPVEPSIEEKREKQRKKSESREKTRADLVA